MRVESSSESGGCITGEGAPSWMVKITILPIYCARAHHHPQRRARRRRPCRSFMKHLSLPPPIAAFRHTVIFSSVGGRGATLYVAAFHLQDGAGREAAMEIPPISNDLPLSIATNRPLTAFNRPRVAVQVEAMMQNQEAAVEIQSFTVKKLTKQVRRQGCAPPLLRPPCFARGYACSLAVPSPAVTPVVLLLPPSPPRYLRAPPTPSFCDVPSAPSPGWSSGWTP